MIRNLRVRQAAIPEMIDPHPLGQTSDAAVMVCMPMGCDEVVEVVKAGDVFENVLDPLRIAVFKARPSRINEDRFLFGE